MSKRLLLVAMYLITLSLTVIDINNTTYTFIISFILLAEFVGILLFTVSDFYNGVFKSVWVPISVSVPCIIYIENFLPYKRIDNGKGDTVNIAITVVLFLVSALFAYNGRRKRTSKLISNDALGIVCDAAVYLIVLTLLVFPSTAIADAYLGNYCIETTECVLEEMTDEYAGDALKLSPATDTFSVSYNCSEADCLPNMVVVKHSLGLKVGDTVPISVKKGFLFDWYMINCETKE